MITCWVGSVLLGTLSILSTATKEKQNIKWNKNFGNPINSNFNLFSCNEKKTLNMFLIVCSLWMLWTASHIGLFYSWISLPAKTGCQIQWWWLKKLCEKWEFRCQHVPHPGHCSIWKVKQQVGDFLFLSLKLII